MRSKTVGARQTTKRIDPNAYNALADALCVVVWNKQPFARLVRGLLRDAPELLVRLDLTGETKRETAGRLVELLMEHEDRYQALTVNLILTIGRMEEFPNLEAQPDREEKIATAKAAVAELRKWTKRHQSIVDDQERHAAERVAAAQTAERNRAFSQSLADLKAEFFVMHTSDDPHGRGLKFEGFLNRLFGLFDLEPRAAYSLEREQIDGAFSFDTDDYILEAKWWKKPIGRGHLDEFRTKVSRKGKNALGLYISVNGFTQDARDEYKSATPFITMTGEDLFAVLEERIRLDDMLRRKKRYANETGSCYFSASQML
jgi:Restriction endonuclease